MGLGPWSRAAADAQGRGAAPAASQSPSVPGCHQIPAFSAVSLQTAEDKTRPSTAEQVTGRGPESDPPNAWERSRFAVRQRRLLAEVQVAAGKVPDAAAQ